TWPQHEALQAAAPAFAAVETDSQRRCERALDMLLTQRGDASAEVERLLADDPRCVFGHCLRAALIVRAESGASRSALGASIVAIETACPDAGDPARRHALAASAWLEGDPAHAVAHYGAVLTDWPQDVLALAVAHALDFHLGRRRVMRDRIAKVHLLGTDGDHHHGRASGRDGPDAPGRAGALRTVVPGAARRV